MPEVPFERPRDRAAEGGQDRAGRGAAQPVGGPDDPADAVAGDVDRGHGVQERFTARADQAGHPEFDDAGVRTRQRGHGGGSFMF